MQPVSLPAGQRQTWIDGLRGASVLLVILAHAHHFAVSADGTSSNSALSLWLIQGLGVVNKLFAPVRMELMFLLSGLFVAHGLGKGPRRYLSGKVRNVLYPFVVWCLINFALREGGSVLFKGEAITWQTLFDLLVGIAPPTWFLFDLFLFFLLVPLVRRYPVYVVLALAATLSVLLKNAGWIRYGEMAYYFAYFVSGDLIGRHRWNPATRWGRAGVIASALCLCLLMALAIGTSLDKTWWGFLPLVLASLPAIVAMAMLAARTLLSSPLAYAGRNSIVFYLVHFTLFIALTYIAERYIHDDVAMFSLLLGAGTFVPAAMSWARSQRPLRGVDLLFSLRRGNARQPEHHGTTSQAGGR